MKYPGGTGPDSTIKNFIGEEIDKKGNSLGVCFVEHTRSLKTNFHLVGVGNSIFKIPLHPRSKFFTAVTSIMITLNHSNERFISLSAHTDNEQVFDLISPSDHIKKEIMLFVPTNKNLFIRVTDIGKRPNKYILRFELKYK